MCGKQFIGDKTRNFAFVRWEVDPLINSSIMPNITLIRDHLFEAIGRTFTEKEFDELCFEFGVEVDDVATETIEVNSCFQCCQ